MRIHEASLLRAARDLRDAAELFRRHTEALLAVTGGGARSPWGIGVVSVAMDRVNELLGEACRHLNGNLGASSAGLRTMAGLHATARESAMAAVLASAGVAHPAAGATSRPDTGLEAGPAGDAPAGGRWAAAPAPAPPAEQGLMLPPGLETAFGMLGVPWFTQDEGALRACAAAYRTCARVLATEVIPAAHHAIGHARANNAGESIDDVTVFWADYHHEGDDSGHLSSLATVLAVLADVHDLAAGFVAGAKRFLIVLAGLVAAALVWGAIAAAVGGGAAALHVRMVIAGLRSVARRFVAVFRRRLEQFLGNAVTRGVATRLRRVLDARGPRVTVAARRTATQARAKGARPDTPRTAAQDPPAPAPPVTPKTAHDTPAATPPVTPKTAPDTPVAASPVAPKTAHDTPASASTSAREPVHEAAQEAPPVVAKTPPPSAGNASPYDLEPADPPAGEYGQKRVAQLRESMATKGWVGRPVFVVHDEGRTFVVDGNHRLRAAEGVLDEIPFKEVELPFMGYRTIKDVRMGWDLNKEMLPDWMAERGRRRSNGG
ncbi:ParB N-terminal domain-containing protein [Nonomuraea sp. NPDC047897]|uniref:ParB N-terminal domain-containing protein n=1 Tax=Nonomuraea sp. NPDC047897 TaxID=3364346 RepID=UPI00371144AE